VTLLKGSIDPPPAQDFTGIYIEKRRNTKPVGMMLTA